MQNNKKYVIVGAGPVGLWTSIQLKLRQPDAQVIVYEKNPEYVRSHVLRLDNWSMILYAKNMNISSEFKQHYDKFISEVSQTKYLIPEFSKSLFIRTNELEDSLKKFAQSLQVNIQYENIESMKMAEEKHPDCKYFIAVDGAKSRLRKEMFPEKDIQEQTLQNILEVKMDVKSSEKIKSFGKRQTAHFQKNSTFSSFEYVGKRKNEMTPISLRIFLTPQEYQDFPHATFKDPVKINQLSSDEIDKIEDERKRDIMKKVNHQINFYLSQKKIHAQDLELEDMKVTKLQLNAYKATSFIHENKEKNTSWFLCGDAAIGVPYFRALNSGMMLSSRLCQILTGEMLAKTTAEKITLYKIQETLHSQTEFKLASFKNNVLSLYNYFFKQIRTPSEEIAHHLIEQVSDKKAITDKIKEQQLQLFGEKKESLYQKI